MFDASVSLMVGTELGRSGSRMASNMPFGVRLVVKLDDSSALLSWMSASDTLSARFRALRAFCSSMTRAPCDPALTSSARAARVRWRMLYHLL